MADKSIEQLIAAESILATDLFVVQQSGVAKKLPGQVLLNWLTAAADGHGGIQSIQKVSTNVLADTYRITLADTTSYDFVVTNGRGVKSITKTSTSGLTDTYTITYNDSSTSTFNVTNGAKGDPGDNVYLWIKYASQEPTASSNSFGDAPDEWIGVYFGFSDTAPTDWREYSWYKIKGEQGDVGNPATLKSSTVTYQASDSGTIVPSGNWSESIPSVAQGKYLWTRAVIQFNTGNPITHYSVSRMGLDGKGSVVSVNNVSPNKNGNVSLGASDVSALPISGGTMEGSINMNGQKLRGLNKPTDSTEAATKGYTTDLMKMASPYNLLDNSNFKNPVNQRGATEYQSAVYGMDRWVGGNSRVKVRITSEGLVIFNPTPSSGVGYIQQILPEETLSSTRDRDKMFTLATKVGNVVYAARARIGTDASVKVPFGSVDLLYSAAKSLMVFRFNTTTTTEYTVEWAALYVGEYDSDTLPEYQPKGYGVELVECQRYYQIRSTNNIAAVDMRPTMRLSSPTVTQVAGGYAYSADL